MTKYTKGPWRVAYASRIEYGPVVAGEGFAVATILRDPAEGRNTARLIAAAPDMVDELRNELEALETWASTKRLSDFESDIKTGFAISIDRIRTLLARIDA